MTSGWRTMLSIMIITLAVAAGGCSSNKDQAQQHYLLGLDLKNQHRLKEAVAEWEKAAELNPELGEVYVNLGTAYFMTGDLQACEEAYVKATKLLPQEALPWEGLAQVYLISGKIQDAAPCLEKAHSIKPDSLETLANLASVRVQQGRVSEALELALEAVKFGGENAQGMVQIQRTLATCYRLLGQYDKAREVLERQLAANPDDAQTKYRYSLLLLETGDVAAAKAKLEELVATDARLVEARNDLAFLLAEEGKDLDRARKLIDEAIEKSPNMGGVFKVTKGWILFKSGDAGGAEEAIRQAIQEIPAGNDAYVSAAYYRLGKVLWAGNRKGEAREAFQKALQLKPTEAQAKDMQALLAS